MKNETIKEILEGQYLKKEYINDNTLLLYKEEDGYLRIKTLFVREESLTTIEQDILISIPLNQSSAYEVQVNENGVAIFYEKNLISVYDAIRKEKIMNSDLLSYSYEEIFQKESRLLKKIS